jgi:quercetin dioxygenase-like cupin family protein
VGASTHEQIEVGEVAIRFLLEAEESAGSVAIFEFDVPAGAKVPVAHSHDGYEETIYGLDGALTWTIEGTPTQVGHGEALFIPRGAVHHFDNTGEVDARALAIVTPASWAQTSFARSLPSSTPRPAARPTSRRSRR